MYTHCFSHQLSVLQASTLYHVASGLFTKLRRFSNQGSNSVPLELLMCYSIIFLLPKTVSELLNTPTTLTGTPIISIFERKLWKLLFKTIPCRVHMRRSCVSPPKKKTTSTSTSAHPVRDQGTKKSDSSGSSPHKAKTCTWRVSWIFWWWRWTPSFFWWLKHAETGVKRVQNQWNWRIWSPFWWFLQKTSKNYQKLSKSRFVGIPKFETPTWTI